MTCFSLSYPMADVDTFNSFFPNERIPLTAACAAVSVVISGISMRVASWRFLRARSASHWFGSIQAFQPRATSATHSE